MHTDDDDHFGPRDKPSQAAIDAGYETTDAPTPPAVIGMVVLVALMVIGFVGGKVFEEIFTATEVKSRPEPSPLAVREEVSGPKLQAHPEVQLEAYLESERQKLASYGWVDRSRGIVRIPIEVAMDIVARDGLPKWEPVDAKLPEPTPEPVEAPAPEAPAPAAPTPTAEEEPSVDTGSEDVSAGDDPTSASEDTASDGEFTGTESLPE